MCNIYNFQYFVIQNHTVYFVSGLKYVFMRNKYFFGNKNCFQTYTFEREKKQ